MYSSLARFYDHENAAFTEDIPFWLELAGDGSGPGEGSAREILEVGCGTGRVLFQLATAGHTVTGLDNSPEMLALAQARLVKRQDLIGRVTLVEGDMRDFSIDTMFRAVFVPFNTFTHLQTQTEQLSTLSALHGHCVPQAVLALDLPNPAGVYAAGDSGLVLERTFRDEARDLTIQQFSSLELDRAAQLGHVTWNYDETAADGTMRRTIVPATFRYVFPAEMSLLLELTGFRLQHIYGDYNQAAFAEGQPRMLVVARAV